MNVITYSAFKDELEKISSGIAGHAAEVAGLGMLAAPTAAKHFGGKEWSEKNKRRIELGGLGVLAAPSAYHLGKALLKKGSVENVIKQAGIFGGMGGARNAVINAAHQAQKGLQGGGVAKAMKLAPQVPKVVPTATQVGGHAFKPATTGKFAPISIPGL